MIPRLPRTAFALLALVAMTLACDLAQAQTICITRNREFFVSNHSGYNVQVTWSSNDPGTWGSGSRTLSFDECLRADTQQEEPTGELDMHWLENTLYTITISVDMGTPHIVVYMDCAQESARHGDSPSPPVDPCQLTQGPLYWRSLPLENGGVNDFLIEINPDGTVGMGHSGWGNAYFTSNPDEIREGYTLYNLKYDFLPLPSMGFFSCRIQFGDDPSGPPGPQARVAEAGAFGAPLFATTAVDSEADALDFAASSYPNPFNPSATITYQVPTSARVHLAVYDALGRRVALLVDRHQDSGRYEAHFEAGELPSGTYFWRLRAGALAQTGRMVLAR